MQVLFQLSYSPTGRAVYQKACDEPEKAAEPGAASRGGGIIRA